jgi:hypothetical protein
MLSIERASPVDQALFRSRTGGTPGGGGSGRPRDRGEGAPSQAPPRQCSQGIGGEPPNVRRNLEVGARRKSHVEAPGPCIRISTPQIDPSGSRRLSRSLTMGPGMRRRVPGCGDGRSRTRSAGPNQARCLWVGKAGSRTPSGRKPANPVSPPPTVARVSACAEEVASASGGPCRGASPGGGRSRTSTSSRAVSSSRRRRGSSGRRRGDRAPSCRSASAAARRRAVRRGSSAGSPVGLRRSRHRR